MFKSSTKLIVLNLFLLNSCLVFTGDSVRRLKIELPESCVFSEAASDSSDPLGLFEPVVPVVRAWAGWRGLKDSFELPRTQEMLKEKRAQETKTKEIQRAHQIEFVRAMGIQTNLNQDSGVGPIVPELGAGCHVKKE